MQMSQVGLALIKSFESCKLEAYKDEGGVLTIGWGHTGPDVFENSVITQEEADNLFEIDVHSRAELPLYHCLNVPVSQNQFDALGCLTYNIGSGAIKKSTIIRKINLGDFEGAATAWTDPATIFNKINGVPSAGLTRRREAEQKLFMAVPNVTGTT